MSMSVPPRSQRTLSKLLEDAIQKLNITPTEKINLRKTIMETPPGEYVDKKLKEILGEEGFEEYKLPVRSLKFTPIKTAKKQDGGAKKHTYKNKEYTVQTGARGGKYIVANGKKVYV